MACRLSCWKSIVGADDHSVAPSVQGPQGDLLEDSLRWSSNLPLFASVAGNGKVVGRGGGRALVGSWGSTVVSLDVPAPGLDVPTLSLDVPVLTGSPLAVMGLLRSAGPHVQPVVALGWSGFSWQSLVRLCRVESCSGAASGRCTWRGSGTALMQCGKSRPSVWFPGL